MYLKQKEFVKQLEGGRITPETLEQLKELNRTDFRLDKQNKRCVYNIVDGDYPSKIAIKFNKRYGGIYQNIDWTQILQNGKTVNPKGSVRFFMPNNGG